MSLQAHPQSDCAVCSTAPTALAIVLIAVALGLLACTHPAKSKTELPCQSAADCGDGFTCEDAICVPEDPGPDPPNCPDDAWFCDDQPPLEEICLEVAPGEVNFGLVPTGQVATATLVVSNCSHVGDVPIEIAMTDDSSDFSLAGGRLDAMLKPKESTTVELDFAPGQLGEHRSWVDVLVEDQPTPEIVVPVVGFADDGVDCPVPLITASDDAGRVASEQVLETIPLATVSFDGRESYDPGGDPIARYSWAVVERPTDSTSVLTNETDRQTDLFIDLAGRYRIELRVDGASNNRSCAPAHMIIDATPDEDIHVQLVWDTPGDRDQTDHGPDAGTDVDLHVLHERGTWNSAPWDCHWLNPEPNWGDRERGDDDPSLDIDDTDGAGPENINLDNPEDVLYQVGAYYYSDKDFGESLVTVRIYLDAALVHQTRGRRLPETGWFWYVADIDWAAREVILVDEVSDGFAP